MPKISALPPADALTGDELVPVVQDGATSRTTVQALADYAIATAPVPATDTVVIHQRWRLGIEADALTGFTAEALPLNTADLPTLAESSGEGDGVYRIAPFGGAYDWADGLQVPLPTFHPGHPPVGGRLVVEGRSMSRLTLRVYDGNGEALSEGWFVVDVLLVFPLVLAPPGA